MKEKKQKKGLQNYTIDSFLQIVIIVLGAILVLLSSLAVVTKIPNLFPSIIKDSSLFDPNLLMALGTILLAISALFIGGKLRKHQEIEAEARANLAINVELKTRLIKTVDKRIVEIIICVHNISRKTWYIPMAYVFPKDALTGAIFPLYKSFNNLAKYESTLCKLSPDEKDEFYGLIVIDKENCKVTPVLRITSEIVGTSETLFKNTEEMMEFIKYMNKEDCVRHTYLCIDRFSDEDDKKSYGERCFILPDLKSTDDFANTKYKVLLANDNLMLWTRETIVNLEEECYLTSSSSRPL